jgi:hypothetical protein
MDYENDFFPVSAVPSTKKKPLDRGDRGEQLAAYLAKARMPTTPSPENPYAFWKTSVIPGKEGSPGLTLDRAVALAGMLASSINPPSVYPQKNFGGTLGVQLTQYAKEGTKAHEDWEIQKRSTGLEQERLDLFGREIAAREQAADKPDLLGVLTGEAGEEPKESYLKAQERLSRAQQPITRERILTEFGPERLKEYVDNLNILEKATDPLKRETAQAALDATNLQIEKYKWDLKNDPLNAEANRKLVDAQTKRLQSEKAKIDAEVKILEDPNLEQLTKEERDSLNEADSAYNKMILALERQYATAGGGRYITDYKKEFTKLSQLADLTNKHATKTNATSTRYRGSAANIGYFTSQVQRYMKEQYKPIADKGPGGLNVGVGRIGGGAVEKQKADAEQYAMALMRHVVELHKKFPGTPESFAIAQQYQDALALKEEQKGK